MEQEKNKFGIKDHYKISLKDTVWLIYAFLKQKPLQEIARNEAIGGTIGKDFFDGNKIVDYIGTMGWFCRNQENENFPKFFLAFETGNYNPLNVPRVPQSDNLNFPNHTFVFESQYEVTEAGIYSMLENLQFKWKNDGQITKKEVKSFVKSKPRDIRGKKYNNYRCNFFENSATVLNDIDEFLKNEEIEAIRYFYGYDDRDLNHYNSNRIRVILMGVDKDGKNILPVDTVKETYSLLQNSWPPPPPKRDT